MRASLITCIMLGHNLVFIGNKYGIDMLCDEYNHCMRSIRKPNLKTKHVNNILQIRTSLDIRTSAYPIEGLQNLIFIQLFIIFLPLIVIF